MRFLNQKLLLCSAVILFLFSECKKGPDDPFISLRTRKARVVGDWKLSSGSRTDERTYNNGTSTIQNDNSSTTYDGNNYTYVLSQLFGSSPYQQTESGTFTMKMRFKKDGSFEIEQTKDGDVTTTKGTWNFTGKVGDNENKEQILLHYTYYADGNSTNNITSGNQTDQAYSIRELRNKKMVLVAESGGTDTFPSSGTSSTTIVSSSKTKYVLEQ